MTGAKLKSIYIKKEKTTFAKNSRAHHNAYFGKRALEAARGATFA